MGRDASYLARCIRMFQRNPFYRYSDESMDEKNRLLLNAECHNKKHFFKYFQNIKFKCIYIYIYIYIHSLEKRSSHLTFRGLHIVIYYYTDSE